MLVEALRDSDIHLVTFVEFDIEECTSDIYEMCPETAITMIVKMMTVPASPQI
jgi:hypothetical protein